ncbi:hypothetical protein [Mycobacterium lacus]|uniref:Uncharacterized protein n=1 Tax=Mycobacterium lacus TaxID=169765 RepID=A0A1X1YNL2_9MYCO|nr:hypothetical protein [Mycobacterium lacus]MCV7124093.1 hypothetical protein [Mycobacterium lacus]ORW12652.1 hypothetical protein AWC15_15505 [Mycobacterium lacus]BBX98402.1 hypothetical protein MLAC_36960 [Mycobacterium lacus]
MADKGVDQDRESAPGTEPFVPDWDDTGPRPSLTLSGREQEAAQAPSTAETAAAPVAVPGRYQYVKWWKLLLVVLGVWLAAAEVGLILFYWWYHTLDKTAAVYVVLVYVVACSVAGLMLSMVQGRPLITALSIGVMSGPFASLAAAAPLYGYYYCERMGHCLVGVIPY